MPGTVKSELLPDADRSHKCDCQEKVSWKRNLPLDKSHFITETAKLNNLNIYAYLEIVLLYMPDYKNEPEGIEELMPWSDMIQQRCRIKSKS